MDWWGGTGGRRGKGGGGVGGPTITLLNINFLQILVSLSLGARGFFFCSFRDDRIQRQSREGATSNSALGSLSLSREGESEKTSSFQAKRPFDSKKSI